VNSDSELDLTYRRVGLYTLVALRQLVDSPDDCFEDVLVLGQSGGHLDEARRQNALCQLRQSLEALDSARLASGRVHRTVLEAPLHPEQVDPRLRQRKPDVDVFARRLCCTPTTAVVPGNDHLVTLCHTWPLTHRYQIPH